MLEWRRDDLFLPEAQATTEKLPSLRIISVGTIFGGVVRLLEPAPAGVRMLSMRPASDRGFVGLQWNMPWQVAQFRRRFFDLEDLPEQMAKIADLGDVNVTFVPRTRARYFEYAPLLHMLPKCVLDLSGLPSLRGGP